MVDSAGPYQRPRRTFIIRVLETRSRRYNAFHDGTLLCSEVTQPFKDAARSLMLEFGAAAEDTIILKLFGTSGEEREAMVSTIGKLAAK